MPASGNETATKLVGYVNDPDGRGTPSLIISCLLTLVLCVWSALHLNVPSQHATRLDIFLLNLRWVIAGLYSPELVVFAAWRQWSSARILQKLVEDTMQRDDDGDVTGSKDIDRRPKRRFEWTMTHSFFACSGGFALELESLKPAMHDIPDSEKSPAPRLTITARGMALLAKCGHLPDVDKQQIDDKSKANDLAKAAVLVQASWMLLQVIGRLGFHLPVTLLEVNTVAHVLCAFAMCIFWWHKPLLPNHPIILYDEELAPLATWMYSSSEISGYVNPNRVKSQTRVKTLLAYLNVYSKTPEMERICFQTNHTLDAEVDSSASEDTVGPTMSIGSAPESCVRAVTAIKEKEKGTAFFERRPRMVDERPPTERTAAVDKTRWALMTQALHTYSGLMHNRIMLTHETDDDHRTCCTHVRAEPLMTDHAQNWPSDDLMRDVDGLVVGMVLWLANFCYGGIHAAAWNDHFPSVAEKWLWRASASYIGFCGGLWVVLNFVVARYPRLNEFWELWADGEKTWLESVGLGLVVFVCGLSLVLARMYIVLEAFISIRQATAAAYQTPQWTNVFPHF
ncbi:hypothetical protein PG988_006365 [Apiospora saccharicola]